MVAYLLRRLAMAVALGLLVLTLIFFVVRAVPGDPAQILASGGANGQATAEAVEQMRQQLGLNQPLWQQFAGYIGGAVTGNLGASFEDGRPVMTAVLERLPHTLELVGFASLLGILLGILLGTVAATRGGVANTVVTGMTSLAISFPVYVLGVVLAFIFAVRLRWLPAGGYTDWDDPAGHLKMLILPSMALAVPLSAVIARMTRAAILETRRQDWVRTARSWGMPPARVFRRHVFRNALTPVVTAVGLEIGLMLGSTVLIERVFSYPGLSALLIDAVQQRDYPVVQGVVILVAMMFIALNIVVDTLYGVLDPRVRR